MKHLLSPGRVYLFRVAAVNLNGTLGFSDPSDFFRLSKSPKAPGKPRNLAPGKSVLTQDGLVRMEISWLPPPSDLPILHYQAYHLLFPPNLLPLLTASLTLGDVGCGARVGPPNVRPRASGRAPREAPGPGSRGRGRRRGSCDVPQVPTPGPRGEPPRAPRPPTRHSLYCRGTSIPPIETDQDSTLASHWQVHAIVASDEEEIDGEKATLVLEPRLPFSTPPPTRPSAHLRALRVDKPFYQDDGLRALLHWAYEAPDEAAEFTVSWWPVFCLGLAPTLPAPTCLTIPFHPSRSTAPELQPGQALFCTQPRPLTRALRSQVWLPVQGELFCRSLCVPCSSEDDGTPRGLWQRSSLAGRCRGHSRGPPSSSKPRSAATLPLGMTPSSVPPPVPTPPSTK